MLHRAMYLPISGRVGAAAELQASCKHALLPSFSGCTAHHARERRMLCQTKPHVAQEPVRFVRQANTCLQAFDMWQAAFVNWADTPWRRSAVAFLQARALTKAALLHAFALLFV